MRKVVTIDGPAGAGKSTVARALAEHLGWRLLDTGAMYRALTLAALRSGTDLQDHEALACLAERTSVKLPHGQVLLDGDDVSHLIRTVEVTRASRHLADNARVRARLVHLQRDFAHEHEVVAEGRDQGTVVFPDAFLKFYLTASIGERARRRLAEFQARGQVIDLETVERDLADRDRHDASRAIAPMKPAEDARLLDTTGIPLPEVIAMIETAIRSKPGAAES